MWRVGAAVWAYVVHANAVVTELDEGGRHAVNGSRLVGEAGHHRFHDLLRDTTAPGRELRFRQGRWRQRESEGSVAGRVAGRLVLTAGSRSASRLAGSAGSPAVAESRHRAAGRAAARPSFLRISDPSARPVDAGLLAGSGLEMPIDSF